MNNESIKQGVQVLFDYGESLEEIIQEINRLKKRLDYLDHRMVTKKILINDTLLRLKEFIDNTEQ